ncbi:Protein kinase-like domain [Pseudocohnilembus persalinus]|uniref:Protein kinase-like domain n=1 Tax=Pseudocohnilembus persalinus TaxID=266149 RepID=A0A0V0QMI1_PSEPJ|nr:Protein kinase-like domain [Pseudocohnilembus persalinus]|eukprot:KRX03351.1 Protein kinase-like domain [Pseudocohnilembus persalinus]
MGQQCTHTFNENEEANQELFEDQKLQVIDKISYQNHYDNGIIIKQYIDDLNKIVKVAMKDEKSLSTYYQQSQKVINEEKIWLILESIVSGLLYLQLNQRAHQNISANSIFIDEINQNNIQYYLVDPKLHKAENLFQKYQKIIEQKQNSVMHLNLFEIGYISPENLNDLKNGKNITFQNEQKSDIFSLGMLILQLLNQSYDIYKIYDFQNFSIDQKSIDKIIKQTYIENKYSSQLLEIVKQMTQVYHENRPDLVDLAENLLFLDKKQIQNKENLLLISNNIQQLKQNQNINESYEEQIVSIDFQEQTIANFQQITNPKLEQNSQYKDSISTQNNTLSLTTQIDTPEQLSNIDIKNQFYQNQLESQNIINNYDNYQNKISDNGEFLIQGKLNQINIQNILLKFLLVNQCKNANCHNEIKEINQPVYKYISIEDNIQNYENNNKQQKSKIILNYQQMNHKRIQSQRNIQQRYQINKIIK